MANVLALGKRLQDLKQSHRKLKRDIAEDLRELDDIRDDVESLAARLRQAGRPKQAKRPPPPRLKGHNKSEARLYSSKATWFFSPKVSAK